MLFYSAAGLPKGGAITVTLPPGTVAADAVVNGVAITGKVRTASGKNVFLKVNPNPSILNPEPSTLNHQQQTLNPKP